MLCWKINVHKVTDTMKVNLHFNSLTSLTKTIGLRKWFHVKVLFKSEDFSDLKEITTFQRKGLKEAERVALLISPFLP